MSASVTVLGHASRLVDPDRALVQFSVSAKGDSRSEALAALAPLSDAAREVLAGLDSPRTAVLSRLSVREATHWDQAAQHMVSEGFVASAQGNVDMDADPVAVVALVEKLAAVEASVGFISWSVDPDNPEFKHLRRLSVRNGRKLAKQFAHGAGMVLGDLVKLAQPGVGGPPAQLESAMRAAGGSAPSVPEVDPQPVRLSASIEVTYLLVPR